MTRLTLRHLTEEDIPFADSLRSIAGWNQTVADWRRFIELSPQGCLVAECEGRPVATATTMNYGAVGWIGMMLVHPDFRRRGIARVLMKHCIEILRVGGVKAIKLDATPEGREVYLRLGFKNEFTVTRHMREGAPQGGPATTSKIRAIRGDDLPAIAALGEGAMGAPREPLLKRLIAGSARALLLESEANKVAAFGLLRGGAQASYLGPIIGDADSSLQIANALAEETGPTVCDIPDHNSAGASWAKANGFEPQRVLTRMVLGQNVSPVAPETYFAIAAPDLG